MFSYPLYNLQNINQFLFIYFTQKSDLKKFWLFLIYY